MKLFKKISKKSCYVLNILTSKKVYIIEIKYLTDEIRIQIYFILNEKRFRASIAQWCI